ncbi:bifunctional oligoribonuclease/PAP phosphatase NrnA [Candidatus Poribacteria bacterium]|nr:bifunctional oligoribonuclease/PAP phosphatase NrnA [Candidatus Poribacteria bacterium]MBT5534319.1 bifunctional oligoribonuclease/PAP phosphatase NrnA [Candidatus Poribacteria bacterium]MBT5710041.1 bifunctional oligoribonuclease/PAP phosphatase NrnA [Candidatus Poribacteria bacterium]MBT7100311.1 bifunctional oligoribonuclease/PAP phosphatase NrnA [Candidatus Poribacteria bacterium]MBT7808776.1 bifunctional oligoribonuclease/PAP phosphatase NrnA [Candidatus Poribacteria bacterium]
MAERSNDDFDAVLEAFQRYDSFWVVSHIHPDPDAIGSQLALAHYLRRHGKRVEVLSRDTVPRVTAYLPGSEWCRQAPETQGLDALVVMDVSSKIRIGRELAALLEPTGATINIDHHATGTPFADVASVRTEACATCEILYDFFQYVDEPIDRDIGECLYAGIIGDTGNFRFSNTSKKAHYIAADLIERGVQPHKAYEHIYGSMTAGQVQLLGLVLGTLERSDDGSIAWLKITQAMYDATGTTTEDVDGFIDYARSVDGVKAVALIGELPDGRIKVSFRSRHEDITVDGLAAAFGGGGHRYAAGCVLEPPIADAERRVLAGLKDLVSNAPSDE